MIPVMVLALFPAFMPRTRGLSKRLYRPAVVFGSIALAAWFVTGLMLSGCAVFPVGSSCLQFLPWSADPGIVAWQGWVIRSWAKAPDVRREDIPAGLGWLPLWRETMLPKRKFMVSLCWGAALLFLLAAAARVSAWAIGLRRVPRPPFMKWTSGALAVGAIGLACWFLSSPDPRFGLGFLIATPAVAFVQMAGIGTQVDGKQRISLFLASTLALLIMWTVVHETVRLHSERGESAAYAWTQIPKPQLQTIVSRGGVRVRVPVGGYQCWDALPPCTPEPADSLYQSALLGHTIYSHHESTDTAPPTPQVESPAGKSRFSVIPGPNVWGAENVTYGGKLYAVRWLQSKADFAVENPSGQPRDVVVSAVLATFQQPRHVHLLVNAKRLAEVYEIANEFWVRGPQQVQFRATLQGGANQLSLTTDEAPGTLPGGRPAALLLVGDIRVEQSAIQH